MLLENLHHSTAAVKEENVGRNWRRVKTEASCLLALLPRNPRLRCTGFKSGAHGTPHSHLHLKVCHAPLGMEEPSVWVSFPSAFSSSFPISALSLPLASANVAFRYPAHTSPVSFLFSILIAAIFLLRFDFGHPQKEEGNIGREGSRG